MSIEKLQKWATMANIADELSDEQLEKVKQTVRRRYELDKESMHQWLEDANKIADLVELKPDEGREGRYEGCANIRFPLITTALINFASRALQEVIKGNKAVNAKIIGSDPQGLKTNKARRVVTVMNSELLHPSSTWPDNTDKMLHLLAAVGTAFKKSYYDPITDKIISRLMPYDKVIVNNNINSLEEAPAITEEIELEKGYIKSGMIQEIFSEHDLELFTHDDDAESWNPEFIEQHVKLDLDGDDIPEPYMVLLHLNSNIILRIRPNYTTDDIITFINSKGVEKVIEIKAYEYFTDYHFIRNPFGFYCYGYGSLLLYVNDAVNTIFNQLVDAGTMSNTVGGIMGSGVRDDPREIEYRLGQYIKLKTAPGVRLADEILPFNFKEPSVVLAELLKYLVEAAKEMTSATKALLGTSETQNVSPSTLMTLVRESMMPIAAIQQRFYWSSTREFHKLFKLYGRFMSIDKYIQILDPSPEEIREFAVPSVGLNGEAILLNTDFDEGSFDIIPTADPTASSQSVRLLKARSMLELSATHPDLVNRREILREGFIALDVEEPDKYLNDPNQPPQPNPKMIELQQKGQKDQAEIQIQMMQLELDKMRLQLDKYKADAQVLVNVANAEAADKEHNLKEYQTFIDGLVKSEELKRDAANTSESPAT